MRRYYVYILSSISKVLYIGVTSDLRRRLAEHRAAGRESFTGRYRVHRLVYVEIAQDVRDAIAREKQIKSWRRAKKVTLVRSLNPEWRDLAREW